MTAFAKLGHRPRGAQAQRFLTELDQRLDGADARVSFFSYTLSVYQCVCKETPCGTNLHISTLRHHRATALATES